MIEAELNRRFKLAVEQFKMELARCGASDPTEGPDRDFSMRRVKPHSLQRTLEGAMARCRYVPHLRVQLKNGWTFDPDVFATDHYCHNRSYCEFDYLGIDKGLLLVVDYRWGEVIDINMRSIPLEAIASMHVAYGAMINKYNNERTSWSGNLPAIVSPVMQEGRVAQ